MALTVLVVDDSRAMRRLQRSVISQLGDIEIVEADDGVSAIYQLRDRDFQVDMILLDWMMPRMDGLSFARRLKENVNLSWIPILMVTSVSDEQRIREAWRIGVDGYLLKPFTKEMLLRAIVALDPNSLKSEREQALKVQGAEEAEQPKKTFLEEIPREVYSRMLGMAETVEVADRMPLLFRGESMSHFLFVVEGEVEEHHPAVDQDGASVKTYGAGECLAVTELMSGDLLASNYITATEAKIARLQKPDFETLLLNHPEVNIALSRHLAAKTRQMDAQQSAGHPLSGSLDLLDVPDLIQALNLRQATGIIEFPDLDATIDVLAGHVVHVAHPDCPVDDGKATFFHLIGQKPKTFRVISEQITRMPNVHISTPKLLLEYTRWVDETGTGRA